MLPNKSLHLVSTFRQQLNGRPTCATCGFGNQNRLRAAVAFDLISRCRVNIYLLSPIRSVTTELNQPDAGSRPEFNVFVVPVRIFWAITANLNI